MKKQAKHYFWPVTYSPAKAVSVTKRRRVSSRGSLVVTQEDNPEVLNYSHMNAPRNMPRTQCIPVFFGYSCTADTLLKSTLPFCNPDEYYHYIDQAMDSCSCVTVLFEGDTAPTQVQVSIGMFNNSERNQCLKFQRGGSSGHYVRLTSRAYLVPWQGAWKDAPIPKTVMIPITGHALCCWNVGVQAVLLLHCFPALSSTLLPIRLRWLQNQRSIFWVAMSAIIGHMKTVRCATVLGSIHRHLSTQRAYSFEPAVYQEGQANNQSVFAQLLNQQRDRVGLLHLAASFLHWPVRLAVPRLASQSFTKLFTQSW